MKKTISLVLLMLIVLFQSTAVCGVGEMKHDGVTYRCVGNKLIIVGVDSSIKTLDVQKKININNDEYTVTSINFGAFSQSNIEVINLPVEGIDINRGAFRDATKLNTVNNLDKSNITSSAALFSGCCNLRSVKLPEKLDLIGESMFSGCSALENITVPKNVVTVDEDGFLGCSRLNKVDLETDSKLKYVGKGAFAGCENLECFYVPQGVDVAEYAFFGCKKLSSDCNIPEIATRCDKNLEEQSKKAELFVRKILENEVKNGRNRDELVDMDDIDKLLYKYTPKSTDTPTVVSKEEFDKLTSDGRLVLYRGDVPCVGKNGQAITIKQINDEFKYGNFYYPSECNGIFCTKYVEHAKSYARDYKSNKIIGSLTQFCFTDVSSNNLRVITRRELKKIQDFYKYSHIENNLAFMHEWCSVGKYRLENGLLNLGVDTMNFSFLARALGYDMIDDECDKLGGDGCSKDTPTSQYEVLNRGKLTVCSENIF